jgi:hypothetical protein
MATEVKFKIENAEQIKLAFGMAPELMQVELRAGLTKAAIELQQSAMLHAPVKTGYLRASHVFNVSGFGLDMRAEVYPTADYGVFVHEGTRFQRAQPWLKESLEAIGYEINNILTKSVQNVFDKIGRMV